MYVGSLRHAYDDTPSWYPYAAGTCLWREQNDSWRSVKVRRDGITVCRCAEVVRLLAPEHSSYTVVVASLYHYSRHQGGLIWLLAGLK